MGCRSVLIKLIFCILFLVLVCHRLGPLAQYKLIITCKCMTPNCMLDLKIPKESNSLRIAPPLPIPLPPPPPRRLIIALTFQPPMDQIQNRFSSSLQRILSQGYRNWTAPTLPRTTALDRLVVWPSRTVLEPLGGVRVLKVWNWLMRISLVTNRRPFPWLLQT